MPIVTGFFFIFLISWLWWWWHFLVLFYYFHLGGAKCWSISSSGDVSSSSLTYPISVIFYMVLTFRNHLIWALLWPPTLQRCYLSHVFISVTIVNIPTDAQLHLFGTVGYSHFEVPHTYIPSFRQCFKPIPDNKPYCQFDGGSLFPFNFIRNFLT